MQNHQETMRPAQPKLYSSKRWIVDDEKSAKDRLWEAGLSLKRMHSRGDINSADRQWLREAMEQLAILDQHLNGAADSKIAPLSAFYPRSHWGQFICSTKGCWEDVDRDWYEDVEVFMFCAEHYDEGTEALDAEDDAA